MSNYLPKPFPHFYFSTITTDRFYIFIYLFIFVPPWYEAIVLAVLFTAVFLVPSEAGTVWSIFLNIVFIVAPHPGVF